MNKEVHQLEIQKRFAFSKEAIFNAFTTPEAFQAWWGPKGYRLWIRTFTCKPDGSLVYNLSNEEDRTGLWYKMVFQEVQPHALISFLFSFSDATGNILRAPFAPAWPLEILASWQFTGSNKDTNVTVHCQPYGATPHEMETFAADASSLKSRINISLERLANYLSAQERSSSRMRH